MKKIFAVSVLAALMPFVANAATGATATTSFDVSMTIKTACTVAASNVNLGTVAARRTTELSGTTAIRVTCSKGTPYNIGLRSTRANAATNGTGTMSGSTGNADTIGYALFQTPDFSKAWGDTATSIDVGNGAGRTSDDGLTAFSHSVYVKVPGSEITNKTADTYRDTITVTVNY